MKGLSLAIVILGVIAIGVGFVRLVSYGTLPALWGIIMLIWGHSITVSIGNLLD